MKISAIEKKHIRELGQRWHKAYGAAILSLKLDPKLVGLDKLREKIATCATLHATGSPNREGIPLHGVRNLGDFPQIVERAFHAAVEAAQKAFS